MVRTAAIEIYETGIKKCCEALKCVSQMVGNTSNNEQPLPKNFRFHMADSYTFTRGSGLCNRR